MNNQNDNEPAEKQEAREGQPKAAEGRSVEDVIENSQGTPDYIQKILTKLSLEEGLGLKSRLEKLRDIVAEELQALEGKEVAAEDKEVKKTLSEFKIRIEKSLEEEMKKEIKISPDIIDRAERDMDFAQEVDKMERGEEYDRQELAGVLERQNWGKIFNNLKKGDRVLSFLVPGADFLSIKYLNDVVVGPQITNKIIEEKRKVVEREIKKLDTTASLLQSDYKTEVVRIPKESQIDAGKLEEMSAAVDASMTGFISEIIDGLLAEEKDKDRIKILEKFKNDLQGLSEKTKGKGGFRMNYGLSEVEGDRIEDKLVGLDHSLQTSRMARESNDGYGAEYSEEQTLSELEKIKDLRETIITVHKNKITDEEGNEFEIFSEQAGKQALNRDVLRDIRKGKFKTQDKKVLEDLSLYIKKLNILDAVKPFTYDEVSRVNKKIRATHDVAKKISDGEELTAEEKKLAVGALRSEEKDPAYTSKTEFHKRAVAITKGVYVSLDVLDLGVDLLLEYESILQDIDKKTGQKKIDEFNKRSLSAGDKTTDKLMDFRKKVADVYKKFGFKDDLVTAEVGGDELTLAIDTGGLSEEKLDEFLFELKRETNTRVIKTVVAQAEKNVLPGSDERGRVEAHLKAIKRGEDGVKIAKDIEDAERKLNRLLQKQGKEAVEEKISNLHGLFSIEKGRVKASVIVVEKDGEFKIANEQKGEEYETFGYQFDYETIHSELDSILGRETAATLVSLKEERKNVA